MCAFNGENVGAEDVGYMTVKAGDEIALKAAVATVGPVSVGLNAPWGIHFYYGGEANDVAAFKYKYIIIKTLLTQVHNF